MRGNRWLVFLVVCSLTVLGVTQSGFGAGFALYEGSARGNALGGAMVGRADDPSALFYNPAGITQLPGLQMMAGFTAITPSTDVEIGGKSYGSKDNVWLAPHFYTTYQFSDKLWFGLGLFSPFGLGTEFEKGWPGSANNYNAVIQSVNINPNIAIKLTDKLSIAAGFDAMWFDLKLENRALDLGPQLGYADQTLSGDSFGYGCNIGARYQLFDWMALGLSYRSQITQNVSGTATFEGPLKTLLHFTDTDVDGSIRLPDMFFMGITFYPTPDFSFEVGAVWNRWSTYDSLTINYADALPNGATSVTVKKNWHDTWRFQTGAEYKAAKWLDLRVGYDFDEEPVNSTYADYLVPANNRHLFSFGPGFHWNNWSLDLSFTYLLITDRTVTSSLSPGFVNPSEFENGNAQLYGMSIGYKF